MSVTCGVCHPAPLNKVIKAQQPAVLTINIHDPLMKTPIRQSKRRRIAAPLIRYTGWKR